jgi:hypothetical protein
MKPGPVYDDGKLCPFSNQSSYTPALAGLLLLIQDFQAVVEAL